MGLSAQCVEFHICLCLIVALIEDIRSPLGWLPLSVTARVIVFISQLWKVLSTCSYRISAATNGAGSPCGIILNDLN